MNPADPQAIAAAAAAFSVFSIVLGLGFYVWYAFALSKLFPKLGAEPWKGWVPVLNEMEILARGGVPAWSVVFFFIPILQLYGLYLKGTAVHAINARFGKGMGMTVLGILLPPVWATILASPSAVPAGEYDKRVEGLMGAGGAAKAPSQNPASGPLAAPRFSGAAATDASGYAMPVPPPPSQTPPPPAAPGFGGPPAPPQPPAPPAPPVATAPPAPPAPVTPAAPPAPPAPPASPITPPAPTDGPPALVEPPGVIHNPWAPRQPAAVPEAPAAVIPPPPVAPAPEATVAPPAPPAPPAPVLSEPPAPAAAPEQIAAPPVTPPAPVVAPEPVLAPVPPAPVASDPPTLATAAEPELITSDDDDDLDSTIVVDRRPVIPWRLIADDGFTVALTGSTAVLGRKPGEVDGTQAISIPDTTKTLSKTHARLELADGAWTVIDLDSTNGVIVVAADGTEDLLEKGGSGVILDRFVLGKVGLRVSFEDETAS